MSRWVKMVQSGLFNGMKRVFAALCALVLCTTMAHAQCAGQNVIGTLPLDSQRAIEAAVAAQPYAKGNFWRATRAGQTVHLIGTYHLDDPRHDAIISRLRPLIANATTLLLEGGPEEEAKLKDHLARNPSLFTAPGLVNAMPPEDWARLATALRARGIPPALGAQLRPWYLSLVLSLPPCAMASAAKGNGLDKRITKIAADRGLGVTPLEPFDTALRLFEHISFEDQIAMILNALAIEDRAEDFLATMADSYFSEDSRLIWELNRVISKTLPGADAAEVEEEFALMEEALMAARNRAWIPVIEQAATKGPALVAFGALHLSGTDGVLALMERDGWTLERLRF